MLTENIQCLMVTFFFVIFLDMLSLVTVASILHCSTMLSYCTTTMYIFSMWVCFDHIGKRRLTGSKRHVSDSETKLHTNLLVKGKGKFVVNVECIDGSQMIKFDKNMTLPFCYDTLFA